MLRAVDVASYIKGIYVDAGLPEDEISNRRISKMLYFTQVRHLANFSVPLFEEKVEAWLHGPVVPFDEYNEFPASREMKDANAKESIIDVILEVGSLTGDELKDLSHNVGSFNASFDGTHRKEMPLESIMNSWNEFVHAVRNSPHLDKLSIEGSIQEKAMSEYNAA